MAKVKFICMSLLWDPIKACVQNGISGSYMGTIFELVVHLRDVDKSTP